MGYHAVIPIVVVCETRPAVPAHGGVVPVQLHGQTGPAGSGVACVVSNTQPTVSSRALRAACTALDGCRKELAGLGASVYELVSMLLFGHVGAYMQLGLALVAFPVPQYMLDLPLLIPYLYIHFDAGV